MTNQKPNNKFLAFIFTFCLVIFAITKIIADLMAVIFFGYHTAREIVDASRKDTFYEAPNFTLCCILLLIDLGLVLDIALMIVLIIGVSMKCNHVNKLSYLYTIISLVIAVLAYITVVVKSNIQGHGSEIFDSLTDSEHLFIHIGIVVAYSFIHVLIIILIKSVMTRISNGHCNNEQGVVGDDRIKRNSQLWYGRFD